MGIPPRAEIFTYSHQNPHEDAAAEGKYDLILETRHHTRPREGRQKNQKSVGYPGTFNTHRVRAVSHIGKTRRNALIMLGHKLNVRQKGQQLTQLIVVGEQERHVEGLPSARFTGFFTWENCHEGRVAVLAMRPHGLGSGKSQSLLR